MTVPSATPKEVKIRSLTKYETEVLRAALEEYISSKRPNRTDTWAAEIILNEMLSNLWWREK
jgi:hypothetical protein